MKFRGTVLIPFRVKSLSVTALRLSAAAGAWLIVVFMAHPVLADVANQLLPVQTVPTSSLIGEKTASLMFGLFIGVMLTATLYLFFIWVILRDRGQVFLMLLLLCLGVSMASTNDQLTDFIGLRGEIILNLVQNYGMILSYVFSIFFTYYFLEIDVYEPRLTSALFGLAIVLLAFLGYAVFDPRSIHFIMPTLGTVAIAAVLTAGIVAMRNGVSGSLMHIVAFSFFLLGGIIEPLYSIGFIADPQTARNLGYASYSYAALLFAVVIATQFAARQEEKERALAVSNRGAQLRKYTRG